MIKIWLFIPITKSNGMKHETINFIIHIGNYFSSITQKTISINIKVSFINSWISQLRETIGFTNHWRSDISKFNF